MELDGKNMDLGYLQMHSLISQLCVWGRVELVLIPFSSISKDQGWGE